MSKLTWLLVGLLLIGLLSACTSSPDVDPRGTYPVDSTFSDFYHEFGDTDFLGPAISPVFSKDGLTYQYVVSGLMAYTPEQASLKRYYFSPIASAEWHINRQIEPSPQVDGMEYLNGHQIWEEILPIYSQYGPDIIGLPLTGVIANDSKQRYEQYFEGLGFYRTYNEDRGQVHLMPYGGWMCGSNCTYHGQDLIPPEPSYDREDTAIEQIFMDASERLGYGFTGDPLDAPRLGMDGNYEMVFENVVLYINSAAGPEIRLRPLPAWQGIRPDPPQKYLRTPGFSFTNTNEGLGFNVPDQFIDYLNNHQAIEYAGAPITQYRKLADSGYSQCFTNLCLEYHPGAPARLVTRPHPLGAEYILNGKRPYPTDAVSTTALRINAWEKYPLIPSGQRQVITVEATQDDKPVQNVRVSVLVNQPDGITKTYSLDPTGDDGKSSIEMDPIDGPNGSIIPYQVCLIDPGIAPVCFSKSYTIWDQ